MIDVVEYVEEWWLNILIFFSNLLLDEIVGVLFMLVSELFWFEYFDYCLDVMGVVLWLDLGVLDVLF